MRLDLVRRHVAIPFRPPRDGQWYIVTHDFSVLIAKENIDHCDRVLGVISTTLHDMRVSEDNLSGAFSLEVLGAELRKLNELFQGVLFEDRRQWSLVVFFTKRGVLL